MASNPSPPTSQSSQDGLAQDELSAETIAIAFGRPRETGEPLNTPLVAASNFRSSLDSDGPEYSRGDGTETTRAFEEVMGALEHGTALAFSSGMAAVSSILDQLPPGSKIVAPEGLYQGTAMVLNEGVARLGWKVLRLPTTADQAWVDAIPGADLVWVESPTNPMLEIANLPLLCETAQSVEVPVAVDNTFATPLGQQPLKWGATFSVHSATKFIGGHSDLLAGVVITSDDRIKPGLDRRRTLGGATPGALETFLALRGLRTLAIRLDRAQANAAELADRLLSHRSVTKVHYPGLPDHPGYELAKLQLAGPGAVLSFEMTGSDTAADTRLSRLRLITPATSLGGVESTIERRAKLAGQGHVPPSLCRLSVGCENVEDLWNDLERSLDGIV